MRARTFLLFARYLSCGKSITFQTPTVSQTNLHREEYFPSKARLGNLFLFAGNVNTHHQPSWQNHSERSYLSETISRFELSFPIFGLCAQIIKLEKFAISRWDATSKPSATNEKFVFSFVPPTLKFTLSDILCSDIFFKVVDGVHKNRDYCDNILEWLLSLILERLLRKLFMITWRHEMKQICFQRRVHDASFVVKISWGFQPFELTTLDRNAQSRRNVNL